jgi:peptidoglycan/LPS O-acetylase OafA/YrhL
MQPGFLHLPAIERASLFLAMIAVIAYPVAYVIHKYVEQPGIRLGKRFIAQRPSSAQPRRGPTPAVPMQRVAIEAVPR